MIKLYSNKVCPFAHRSRLALALKGIEHELIEVSLRPMPDWYKEISPNQCVPLLEHDGRQIWESSIIGEYVEDAFPGNPLLPRDPYLRARARIALDLAGGKLIPLFYKVMRGEAEGSPADLLRQELTALEGTMVGDGPFWVGSEPSLADVGIYPWFERDSVLHHYHGLRLDASERLNRWRDAMKALPAVQREANEPEVYIEAYQQYAPASAAK